MSIAKLLLATLEATYDTDPTPDDSNAIENIGLVILRYEGAKLTRDVDLHTIGGKPSIQHQPAHAKQLPGAGRLIGNLRRLDRTPGSRRSVARLRLRRHDRHHPELGAR